MAEHRLKALTAMGKAATIGEQIGPVTLTERMDVTLASVAIRRGGGEEVAVKAAEAGIPLPGPGQASSSTPWAAFWISPEMWMVEAPFETHEDVASHVKVVFGEAVSVTEQTDAWVRFDVEGPLELLFERLCNVDLGRFAPGSATRTMMDHLGVYVVRRSEDQMSVLGPRSAARSLHHAIATAARSAF